MSWLAREAKAVSSRLTKRPCQSNKQKVSEEETQHQYLVSIYIHMHKHAYTNTYTAYTICMQKKNQRKNSVFPENLYVVKPTLIYSLH